MSFKNTGTMIHEGKEITLKAMRRKIRQYKKDINKDYIYEHDIYLLGRVGRKPHPCNIKRVELKKAIMLLSSGKYTVLEQPDEKA